MKITGLILVLLLLFPTVVRADDGEFWDWAVASVIPATKKMDETFVQIKAGPSFLFDVDTNKLENADEPASARLDLALGVSGIPIRKYSRIGRMSGSVSLGFDDGKATHWDSYFAKLEVLNYVNSGSISIGIPVFSREKAVNEEFAFKGQVFDYTVGGGIESFIFSLSVTPLGYEYKNFYYGDSYHGFYVVGLGLELGFVIARNNLLSFEIATKGDIEVSLPTQKDLDAKTELVLHVNNRLIPFEVSAFGGYTYTTEKENDFKYSFFSVGAMAGARF